MILLAIPLLLACGPAGYDASVAKRIEAEVATIGAGASINLWHLIPGDFDRLYSFPGYTADNDVRAVVGEDWPAGEDSSVPYDGQELIVWTEGTSVAGWTKLNAGDIASAVRFAEPTRATKASEAEFRIGLSGETVGGAPIFSLGAMEP